MVSAEIATGTLSSDAKCNTPCDMFVLESGSYGDLSIWILRRPDGERGR
jgi:hypothetical protein